MEEENQQEAQPIMKPCGPQFIRKRVPRDRTEEEYRERLRLEAEQLEEETP